MSDGHRRDARSQTAETAEEGQQRLGRELVNRLFVLLRTAYVHRQNNAALLPPLANIQSTATALFEATRSSEVGLRLVSSTFFVDDMLLKLEQDTFQNAEFLRIIYEELEIGAFGFHQGCDEVAFRALMVALVETVRGGPSAVPAMCRDFGTIKLLPPIQQEGGGGRMSQREAVLRTWATALAFSSRMVVAWKEGQPPRLRHIKRVVQGLLEILEGDTPTVLGLLRSKLYRDTLASHLVSVAVLSLVIGREAGLPRPSLIRLGICALLHEAGGIDLPGELLVRSEPLGPREMAQLRRLPYLNVARLMELDGAGPRAFARVVSAFENRAHVPGEAAASDGEDGDVVGQIVAAADAYDHLTSTRMGSQADLPDRAIQALLSGRGGPVALWAAKLLSAGIGRFPIGSVVELDTGEVAVVCDRPRVGQVATRPRAWVALEKDGAAHEEPVPVDLSEKDPSGRFARTVVRTHAPEPLGLNVARFFV